MVGPCPAVAAARERPLTARSPYAGLPGGGRLPRDLRNRRGEQIRHAGAVGVVVPQNCGWRHRRFELVSCRFGVEIGARVIIRSHCGPAVPSVYLGEPPKGAFGPPRLLGASRIRGKQAWRKSLSSPFCLAQMLDSHARPSNNNKKLNSRFVGHGTTTQLVSWGHDASPFSQRADFTHVLSASPSTQRCT